MEKAEVLGRTTGFVERSSKVSGSVFVRRVVFGWLGKPGASLGELAQTTAAMGVKLSPQGLEQRMDEDAATFLKAVLDEGVRVLVNAEPVTLPMLARFNGVYLMDGSTVVLPDELPP